METESVSPPLNLDRVHGCPSAEMCKVTMGGFLGPGLKKLAASSRLLETRHRVVRKLKQPLEKPTRRGAGVSAPGGVDTAPPLRAHSDPLPAQPKQQVCGPARQGSLLWKVGRVVHCTTVGRHRDFQLKKERVWGCSRKW